MSFTVLRRAHLCFFSLQMLALSPSAPLLVVVFAAGTAVGQPLTYSELLQTPAPALMSRSRWTQPMPDADAVGLPEAATERWLDRALDSLERDRPWTQLDGYCLQHMAGDKNAHPPVVGKCENDFGKNILCLAECPTALHEVPGTKNCSTDLIDAFCNGNIGCDPHGCHLEKMISPRCHTKLVSMIDLLKPKTPPDDTSGSSPEVAGRRLQPDQGGEGGPSKPPSKEVKDAYQALSSWSTHMGIRGHFYQCVALDSYYFWQAHFMCNGEKPPLGEQLCYGQNQYAVHEMDLCVPEECNNNQDVRGIANLYAEYGLMHSWLDFQVSPASLIPSFPATESVTCGSVCARFCSTRISQWHHHSRLSGITVSRLSQRSRCWALSASSPLSPVLPAATGSASLAATHPYRWKNMSSCAPRSCWKSVARP